MCSHRLRAPEPPSPCGRAFGTRAVFAETAWLPSDEVLEVLRALGQLAQEISPPLCAQGFDFLTSSVASELGHTTLGAPVGVSKGAVLDLAAELVCLADAMGAEGRYVTMFALEGIEARLMAALTAS